jgi:hypothetical protein
MVMLCILEFHYFNHDYDGGVYADQHVGCVPLIEDSLMMSPLYQNM